MLLYIQAYHFCCAKVEKYTQENTGFMVNLMTGIITSCKIFAVLPAINYYLGFLTVVDEIFTRFLNGALLPSE